MTALEPGRPFVLGGDPRPLAQARRADDRGRELSLAHRATDGAAVLFTGPAGIGKTTELRRSAAAAAAAGWLVLQVSASADEPLKHQFVRALDAAAPGFRDRLGRRAVSRLARAASDMLVAGRGEQRMANIGIWSTPLLAGVTRARTADYAAVSRTPADLVEACCAEASTAGARVLVTIDDAGAVRPQDLGFVNEIATRMDRRQGLLVVAGEPEVVARLRSSGERLYDERRINPFSDAQLHRLLSDGLRGAGRRAEPVAMRRLIHAANGNPRRLQRLGSEAVRTPVVTAAVARDAIRAVNEQDRPVYENRWATSSWPERDLLRRLATVAPQPGVADPRALDDAASSLLARGLVRMDPGTDALRIADPGLQQWVVQHDAMLSTQLELSNPGRNAVAGSHGQQASVVRPAGGRHRTVDR